MFDPILVPLDGSLLAECVLPHVIAITRAFGAGIMLLRVLDRNQAGEKAQLFDLLNWQINKAGAKLYLDKTGTRLQKFGLRPNTAILEGLVAETITEYAQEKGMNLIIMSSHGHSGLSQWGLSSVTQKIIFSAPTSILIIRAQRPSSVELTEGQYAHIMVPLDGSRRAENVLPMVTRLARFHKSSVHLVHVVKTPEMARQMPPLQEDVELANRIVTRNHEEASRYLERIRLQSPLDGLDVQSHLLTGDNAPVALHDLAEREHIDMIALSAHGYSGNDQWPYGSLVSNFILYSKVPLLIVQDLPIKDETAAPSMPVRDSIEH
jgi:nucleotide-binding universal stress UspA family protein